MSSDLLREYKRHRDQGHGHYAALLALSRRFNLDRDTLSRLISHAQADEARTQRKETNAA